MRPCYFPAHEKSSSSNPLQGEPVLVQLVFNWSMITNNLTFRFVVILSVLTVLNMMFIGVSWHRKEEYACSVDMVIQGVAKYLRSNGRHKLEQELIEPCRKSVASTKTEEALKAAVKSVIEICENKKGMTKNFSNPLITLFTTWPNVTSKAKDSVHNLTIENWLSFKPKVNLVVFTNDTNVADLAKSKGFHAFPILNHAGGEAPILKNMFLTAEKHFPSSHLLGYVNSDILFTQGLIETLEHILSTRSYKLDVPFLLIGRRLNVLNVTQNEVQSYESIETTAKTRGKLFGNNAEDFFITNKAFPWKSILEVVVGRVAYDNWLVGHVICNLQIDVIDVTETVMAVHQTTDKGGNFEGFQHKHAHYNDWLFKQRGIKPVFETGFTICAQEITYRTLCGDIAVAKRDSFWPRCKCPIKRNHPKKNDNTKTSATLRVSG